jgi:hypothetical protein
MGNKDFRGIEMETAWKLIKSTIIPIITYVGETMNPNKTETKELNNILDNIIKRTLMIPNSTPREPIYLECGLLDIESTINRNKLLMYNRIHRTGNELTRTNLNNENKTKWRQEIDHILERYNIHEEELRNNKKEQVKKLINKKIWEKFKRELVISGMEKTKCKHYITNTDSNDKRHPNNYTNKLTRKQVSTIFKARTRMLDTKANYKGKYQDSKCRHCSKEEETQDHILSRCIVTTNNKTNIVTTDDISMGSKELLKGTADQINKIMAKHQQE